MKIKNPAEARQYIDSLLPLPPAVQTRNLRLALENQELDQMYYEQKGNEQGVQRCEECLLLLRQRLAELK